MKLIANGIQISFTDTGRGAMTLVFLHYWGGSSRTWEGVIAHLANQYRCVATDHRGWGDSDSPKDGYRISDLADDAMGVISGLQLERYVLVGHSMGGKVAQLLAARQPMGLVGLVLVAPSPPSPTVLPEEQRQALLHAYDSRESIAYVRDHILTALPLSQAQQEQVIEDSLRGAAQAKRAWPTQAMLEDIRPEVARINAPTLVLSGERDQVDSTESLRKELMPCITAARLQVLPGAGHLSMLEAPHAVAQAIGQFVAAL